MQLKSNIQTQINLRYVKNIMVIPDLQFNKERFKYNQSKI